MKFLQAYYTSCDVGQTGVSGFQFYSHSEGITDEELQEIRELGSYEAPFGFPVNPTEEEVLSLFPIAFKYFRLKSGRVGVMQTTACTMEYTGRPGNFFTHTLLLEQGEFPYWPVMFHKSRLFMHDLTDVQKKVTAVPPKLPAITLHTQEDIQSESFKRYNRTFIENFLKNGNNKILISKLLDIILGGKNEKKSIIIADDKIEDIAYVLSAALPQLSVSSLTFSTYSRQPEGQNVVLSGSRSEGSAFEFENEWMQRSYYVFNKTNEQYPELSDQSIFSERVVELLLNQPENLSGLYQFSNYFNAEKSTANLDIIANIYTTHSFGSIWKQVLNFVAQCAQTTYIEKFISDYSRHINELPAKVTSQEDYLVLLKSVNSIVNKSTEPSSHFNWLFSLYTDILHRILQSSAGELIRFNKDISGLLINSNKALFTKSFFKDDVFLDLYSRSKDENTKLKAFTLIISTSKMLSGSLGKISNFYTVPGIKKFITTLDSGRKIVEAETIRTFISEMSDDLGEIVLQFGQSGSVDTAKWLIEEFYKNPPSNESVIKLEDLLIHSSQRNLYYYSLPYYYDRNKENENFFSMIIEKEPAGSDFQQLNLFIYQTFGKNSSIPVSTETLNKIINNPRITDNTCKAIILKLEQTLLTQKLNTSDLKKLGIIKNKINQLFKRQETPTIDLILSAENFLAEEKYEMVFEKTAAFPNSEKGKLTNFYDYYRTKIMKGILEKNDWKSISLFSKYIPTDTLQEQISDHLTNINEVESIVSFIIFAACNGKNNWDEPVKKILVDLNRKKYSQLKELIKNESQVVTSYFDTLDKKIKLKRFIQFKF